jgi:glucose 1-dehydrogenase
MKLAGKKALVTGAARGIGRGCALELARAGADVAVNDRVRTEQAEAVVAEIRKLGRQAFLVEGDVFVRSSCEDVAARAVAALGWIDILVSNPAFSRHGAFLTYDPADFERTMNGTLASGFHMSQLVARHMVGRRAGGKIVFISSVQAEMPIPLCAPYGAAKAGLNHLTRSISVELAPHRINVNAIEPGWIDTPGERELFAEETIQAEGPLLPWGRMGLPEDIGKAAAFLASDDADYITGVVLPVDGGFRHKDCKPEKIIKDQP